MRGRDRRGEHQALQYRRRHDTRSCDYPWLPDPEQKLKETRAEWLEGAGSAGRHGSSGAYVQREMAPSAPITFVLQPQKIPALFFFVFVNE